MLSRQRQLREWRNWQTRTFEGRVVYTVRVQVPFLAPKTHPQRVRFSFIFFIIVAVSLRLQQNKMRVWRNWQTRKIQVLVGATLYRFKSCYPHHRRRGLCIVRDDFSLKSHLSLTPSLLLSETVHAQVACSVVNALATALLCYHPVSVPRLRREGSNLSIKKPKSSFLLPLDKQYKSESCPCWRRVRICCFPLLS